MDKYVRREKYTYEQQSTDKKWWERKSKAKLLHW